ncbi:dnaJ homolog subfamily C member 21 [Photinus pyralis]|uniref:J domain-containing protein n=1 Tax=Photinus pyralis TaxID=7054 RepID=A0A1Y1KKF6_PHOPY|nr:dnaJ homolog subfamily C member 21 [Photinus pyralis]
MKCHYKVLEIETDADDSQIKTAYRKLALKWHPDKNLDNVEYAKEQFQFVQQAYDVLSDRQERAWYDKHRDQILYAKDYQDSALDVFQYFTTSCFKGYNDGPDGFYTVYRQVFEKIVAEDTEHADDDADSSIPPSFGSSTSDYDDIVGPFYAYWTSYNTKRSYAWLNPHNIQEVRDRRIFKLVEKENKKVRQKAKKERNEEVRALVAFVKKRDERVLENSRRLEAKIAHNRQKQEELSRQKRLERRKELSDAQPAAEWTRFDNVERQLKDIEKELAETFGEEVSGDESKDSDSELDENLFCVACNKLFKSTKGYANHETSKKHKQNVKILKETMTAEDFKENATPEDLHAADDQNAETDDLVHDDVDRKKTKKAKNVLQTTYHSDSEIDNEFIVQENGDEDHFGEASTKKKRRKPKSGTVKTDVLKETEDVKLEQTSDAQSEKKGKSKNKVKNKSKVPVRQPERDQDNVCVTCKSQFPSKNKLFSHLKSTQHSVYLPATSHSKNSKE